MPLSKIEKYLTPSMATFEVLRTKPMASNAQDTTRMQSSRRYLLVAELNEISLDS